uniref:Uncharacterized protein n=1 Tax=Clandestinovirus TaxID=2831644 RepID=A0A8F8KRM5_9VIRU|nr:hypothetical protein KOM_12_454 [Clandestinovirus]
MNKRTVRASRVESIDPQGRLIFRDVVEWAEDQKGTIHFKKVFQEPRKHITVNAISKDWSAITNQYTFEVKRELLLADGKIRTDKFTVEAERPDSLNTIIESMLGIKALTMKQRETMAKTKPMISDEQFRSLLPVTPATDAAIDQDLEFDPVETQFTDWMNDAKEEKPKKPKRQTTADSSKSSISTTSELGDRPQFSFTQARKKYTFDLMKLYKRYLRARRIHQGGKFVFINPLSKKQINRQTITRLLSESRAYLADHSLPVSVK